MYVLKGCSLHCEEGLPQETAQMDEPEEITIIAGFSLADISMSSMFCCCPSKDIAFTPTGIWLHWFIEYASVGMCLKDHTHTHVLARLGQAVRFIPWSRPSLQKWQHMENQSKWVHTSITSTRPQPPQSVSLSHIPLFNTPLPSPSVSVCLPVCTPAIPLCSHRSPLFLLCYLERRRLH